jgi:arylsulfatase A-like enzyme
MKNRIEEKIAFLTLVLLIGTFSGMACASEQDARKAPNIILLMADDMGWGDTSHNGNPNLRTPNLDKMANAGVVFNRFYSAAPVCSPTRASVLTGRHPFRDKIFFAMVGDSPNALKPVDSSLGRLMKDAGYRTGFFGKWHLGTMTTEVIDGRYGGPGSEQMYSPPWQHGFDVVFATESRVPTYDPMIRPRSQLGSDPKRRPIEEAVEGTQRSWWAPLDSTEEGIFFGTHYWKETGYAATRELSGDDSRILVDEAINFIEKDKGGEQPFFAVVWFHTPHLPLVAGKQDQQAYKEHDFFDRTYYGAVSALDRELGRLRKALKDAGIADETVLWFTSDNGPEGFADIKPGQTRGLRGRKRSLYEGGIRVPGIVEWPARIKAGSTTDVPAVTSDILPTVLTWAGIELPGERLLDGKDLDAIMLGKETSRNSPIGFESQYQMAWTDDRYKLVFIPQNLDAKAKQAARHSQNPATDLNFEIYDIVNDPGETTNIASEYPEIVQEMTQQLSAWRKSVAQSIEGLEP